MSVWYQWPAAGCGVWAASRHRSASSPISRSRPLAAVELTTSCHCKRTCSRIESPILYVLFGHFRLCRFVMKSGRQRPDGGCPLKPVPTMTRSEPSSVRWWNVCKVASFLFLLLRHERVQPIRCMLPYPALGTFRTSERLPTGLEHSCSPRSNTSLKNQTTSLNISNRQSCSRTLCSAQLRAAFKGVSFGHVVGLIAVWSGQS